MTRPRSRSRRETRSIERGPSWFVAFPVEAGDWLARVRTPPPGTRLIEPVDLHLTVAFLGRVGPACAERAFEALARSPPDRFEGRLSGAEPMGDPRRASALAALLDAHNGRGQTLEAALGELRQSVLDAASLPPETRAPLPHITLARLTRSARAVERRAAVDWARALDLTGVRVRLDRVALYCGSPAGSASASAYRIVTAVACRASPAG